MDIKNLELTEADFKMLVDGLDALPEKGIAGELVGVMIEGMLSDRNPETMARYKREQETKRKAADLAKETLKDDIRILQGKLLMFKRWLIETNALKQVNDLIHPSTTK